MVHCDPLATLGFLAACTSRFRLATSVIVLGYHLPLEAAATSAGHYREQLEALRAVSESV